MPLSKSAKKAYRNAIVELDPNNQYVEVDLENERVRYNPEIETDRRPKFEDEELCRAYLVALLCKKLGYAPKHLYLEKEYTIGRPGGTSAYGDILVRTTEDGYRPFLLIEVKAPEDYDEEDDQSIKGQLFDIAPLESGVSALSYSTVIQTAEGVEVRSLVVDYTRYPQFEAWISEGRPVSGELPAHFGRPVPEPLIKGGERDLRKNVSIDEYKRVWRRLHNLLWGGHREANDVFKWVTRLFLAKIRDEKIRSNGEEYEFQIKYVGGKPETARETFESINNLYKDAVAAYLQTDLEPEEVRDIDRDEFGVFEVRSVVESLQEFSIIPDPHSGRTGDLLGAFFGQVIREGFKQSKGTYLTDPNLAFFILQAIDLEGLVEEKLQQSGSIDSRAPYIIDPACGSGTFLLAAMQIVRRHIRENEERLARNADLREAVEKLYKSPGDWALTHVYGIDPHSSLPVAAKVNMILHQDGSGHIFQDGGLLPLDRYSSMDDRRRLDPTENPSDSTYGYPVSETFDVVVTNPPFSLDLSTDEKSQLRNSFRFSQVNKSENLFFERWYQLLAPGGRLGVVMPESFFSVGENSYIRHFLFKYFNIKAIIHLPDTAFQPFTTTLTSLLFAQKKTRTEVAEWNTVWREENEDLEAEVSELRRKLYKQEWPPEDVNSEELREWIKERVDECSKFLDSEQIKELYGNDSVEQVVSKLKYALTRAVNGDQEKILIKRTCNRLNYSFPVITVENIGYKQTKRSVRLRPNELFRATDTNGNTVNHIESVDQSFELYINTEKPETALDYIRKLVQWE